MSAPKRSVDEFISTEDLIQAKRTRVDEHLVIDEERCSPLFPTSLEFTSNGIISAVSQFNAWQFRFSKERKTYYKDAGQKVPLADWSNTAVTLIEVHKPHDLGTPMDWEKWRCELPRLGEFLRKLDKKPHIVFKISLTGPADSDMLLPAQIVAYLNQVKSLCAGYPEAVIPEVKMTSLITTMEDVINQLEKDKDFNLAIFQQRRNCEVDASNIGLEGEQLDAYIIQHLEVPGSNLGGLSLRGILGRYDMKAACKGYLIDILRSVKQLRALNNQSTRQATADELKAEEANAKKPKAKREKAAASMIENVVFTVDANNVASSDKFNLSLIVMKTALATLRGRETVA